MVFFIYSGERVTGGRLQIYNLYRLSREHFRGTDTGVVMCWLPGQGTYAHRVSSHRNDVTVCPLWMVLEHCRPDARLLFHVPEYIAPAFCERMIGWRRLGELRRRHGLRINILNQHIEAMPGPEFIARLKALIPDLTQAASSVNWASPAEQQRLGIPAHWLPTWYYPDDAPWQPYESKRDMLIVSPDRCEHRESVLAAIQRELPDLPIVVINNMAFEEYLEHEKAAKWSLTFGEGLDGYFYGPVLRGAVSFAVRNHTFDNVATDRWITTYRDYAHMAEAMASHIRRLDNKSDYESYNRMLRERILEESSPEALTRQLERFYAGDYSYHPMHEQAVGESRSV